MADDQDHVEKAIKKHTRARMHKKFQRRKMNENEQAVNIIRLSPFGTARMQTELKRETFT